MPRVEVTRAALEDLDRLIAVLTLPADTRSRIKASLAPLARFPRIGPELSGRWQGLRFILGPWRWMLIVYEYIETEDRVVILTIQDARSSAAVTERLITQAGPRSRRHAARYSKISEASSDETR